MSINFSFSRYVPSLSQLFYMFVIMTIGITFGTCLAFLFDGSSFMTAHTKFFTSYLPFQMSSSTVMAMKRSVELIPISFSASCVTSIFVTALKDKEEIVNLAEVFRSSWRVGVVLSGLLGGFFLGASVLTLIDITISLGKNIPLIGALFSLIYGLIYPIATLLSMLLILFGYFIALGPLHAVGLLEQERIKETTGGGITLKNILLSVKDLITHSGASIRSVLICGWTFGVIPFFCYQLFLLSTLNPVSPQEGLSLSLLQNLMLSLSTAVVESPFLIASLFCSFFFVAKARDSASF